MKGIIFKGPLEDRSWKNQDTEEHQDSRRRPELDHQEFKVNDIKVNHLWVKILGKKPRVKNLGKSGLLIWVTHSW